MNKYNLENFKQDFPDERAAYAYVLAIKKPKFKVYKVKAGLGFVKHDGSYYAPLANTIFKGTHLPLDKWFFAVFLLHYSPFWSIKQFAKYIGVSPVTSFRIIRKIRPVMDRRKSYITLLDELVKGN